MNSDKSAKLRFFITGGGTGGHIYPAAAIANALRGKGHEIIYVGNPKNLEKNIAEKEGYEFLDVDISGMPRHLGLDIIVWFLKLFVSILKSVCYILKYRPDMIFGTGGYVSAPALFAAILLRKPFAIHDCDAVPGIVSRTVAPYAKFVSVAFESSKDYLKSKNIIPNGNPVRIDFQKYTKSEAREKLGLVEKVTLLVMGGSQGAKRINDAVIDALPALFSSYDIQIIHQTGKKNYEDALSRLEEVYPEFKVNKNYIAAPYFDEMYVPLRASDIVISRAGSLSISEICACSLASVLVPYPHAAADHQRKNALEMKRLNASIYLEDSECSGEKLVGYVDELIKNKEELKAYQKNASLLAKPDALPCILHEIGECLKTVL